MRLHIEDIEGGKFVRVGDNVDFGNVEDFGRAVEGIVGEGVRRLVFDLSAVSFLNSTAIGILALTYRALKQRGGRVVLIVRAPEIHRLLAVSSFTELFEVVATEEEALAAMGADEPPSTAKV